MCGSTVEFQSLTAEIRRGNKKEKRRRRRNRMKIYWSALFYRATIIKCATSLTCAMSKQLPQYEYFLGYWLVSAVLEHSSAVDV